MPPLPSRRQAGLSGLGILSLVIAVAAAGGAGWWWGQRTSSTPANATERAAGGRAGALSDSPSGAASGAAPGSVSAASSAQGGTAGAPSAAASGAAGRRFGGANRVQPVTVSAARKQDVKVVLSAIGNISALNTATVRARVDGELKAIRFKEGQLVKAGALLAEIDPRAFEIALAQVQGQMAKDQALLKNAQVDLLRYKDLLAKDSIAKQLVDTQDALVGQLTAAVQTDQALVDSARLQLSYTKVTAPITGRLGLKQADLGNMVRSSDALGLVTITQTQPISVVFAVPESNLPLIARKLKGTEPLTVEAWDREQRNLLASGKVSTTDNAIDAVTGTIKVKAEFANADGALFPNQFVNIKLQVNTLADALSIPSTAVQRAAQGTFVYVVKADSSVSIRRIRLGTTEGDWVSVQGDLEAGDKVVTDGADRLRDGAKVEVITPAVRPGGTGGFGGPGAAGGASRPGGSPTAAAPARATDAPALGASAAKSARPSGNSSGNSSANPSANPSADAPGQTAPVAPASPSPSTNAKPAATSGAPASSAWIDSLPPEAQERVRAVMSRLSPEEAARVNKMSGDERRAFFQQLRERRQQQQSQ